MQKEAPGLGVNKARSTQLLSRLVGGGGVSRGTDACPPELSRPGEGGAELLEPPYSPTETVNEDKGFGGKKLKTGVRFRGAAPLETPKCPLPRSRMSPGPLATPQLNVPMCPHSGQRGESHGSLPSFREPCRHPTRVPLKVNRGSRPRTEECVLARLGGTAAWTACQTRMREVCDCPRHRATTIPGDMDEATVSGRLVRLSQ